MAVSIDDPQGPAQPWPIRILCFKHDFEIARHLEMLELQMLGGIPRGMKQFRMREAIQDARAS